jgi:serine/threonine protein kinase
MVAGRHPNIVHIWTHGWLSGAGGHYFIDMDFGEFTLSAYIKYLHEDGAPSLQIDTDVMKNGVCNREGCSDAQRAHNLWVIGSHIARGLEFLHGREYVHRDLKPKNGFSKVNPLLIVVLYFAKEDTWKLTDFGISAEATSKMLWTEFSRGTGGYRAPELLKEYARFGRSVDIWALGCVLYEIATGKRPFADDFAVSQFASIGNSDSPPVCQDGTEFYRHHLNGVLCDLLSRQPQQRPNASNIRTTFDSYCRVFGLSTIRPLYSSSVYPSYQEWKKRLVSDVEILYFWLAKDLMTKERDSAISLLMEMALRLDWHRPSDTNPFTPERLKELNPTIMQELGQALMERGHQTQAVIIFKASIHAYPKKFDLQRILADYYVQMSREGSPASPHLDMMFTTAFTSDSVSNPRLIYRELSIVYLEAGLEPPVLSAEQEGMAYPWTAIRTSHEHVLHHAYIQAMYVHRAVLNSNKTDWSRLVWDLVEHFDNRLLKTSQTDSRDDEFKRYNPIPRLLITGHYNSLRR